PVASKSKSGNTTTVPTIKLGSTTWRRKRKSFPIVIALLALFVALASGAGLWSLFGSQRGVLSVTPQLSPQGTASIAISPSPDPTSTVVSGKRVPTPSPTLPSSGSSLPPQATLTAPASIPTAAPTRQPAPTPRPY